MHFLGKSFEGSYAYDSPQALQSLKNMADAGVTHVTFTFCWYLNATRSQQGWRFATGPIVPVPGPAPSGVIYANASSPSDAELTTIIAAAHSLNLTVKLRPTVDPHYEFIAGCTEETADKGGCAGRGEIGHTFSSQQWTDFFEGRGGYGDYVLHMAALAERTRCEILSVGVELTAAMAQEQHYRTLIARVRQVFTGEIHNDCSGFPGFCPTGVKST